MAIAPKICSTQPLVETTAKARHVEVAVLQLTTATDGVKIDIKDSLIYEVGDATTSKAFVDSGNQMKSKYLSRRIGQKEALEKALVLYEDRRKDYVAIVACLEIQENKNEEETLKLRETRKFLRKLQRRMQKARKMLAAIPVDDSEHILSNTKDVNVAVRLARWPSASTDLKSQVTSKPHPEVSIEALKIPMMPKEDLALTLSGKTVKRKDVAQNSTSTAPASVTVDCRNEDINLLLRQNVDVAKLMTADSSQQQQADDNTRFSNSAQTQALKSKKSGKGKRETGDVTSGVVVGSAVEKGISNSFRSVDTPFLGRYSLYGLQIQPLYRDNPRLPTDSKHIKRSSSTTRLANTRMFWSKAVPKSDRCTIISANMIQECNGAGH